MSIKISCACGKTFSVKDELVGRRVKCPACHRTFSVTAPVVQDESLDAARDEPDHAEDVLLFDDESAESSITSRRATGPVKTWAISFDEDSEDDAPSGRNRGLLIGLSIGGAGLAILLLAWILLPAKPEDDVAQKTAENMTHRPEQSTGGIAASQDEIQQSHNKLTAIAQALGKNLPNDLTKKAYPAGYSDSEGKLILSWRVAILPALGENELFAQFRLDEPWDSDHNRQLIPKMPAVFKAVRGESKEGHTYYRGFAGSEAMFPLKSAKPEKVLHGDRWCYPVWCRAFERTTDGTTNTFLIGEGAESVPWTKPEELICDSKQPLPKLGGQFDGECVAMTSDGVTRLMARTIPEPAVRAAITAAGGENIRFMATAERGHIIEFVTPAMEERMYALGRLAEKSPRTSMAQITDAANETAFAGIVAEGRAVPWTKPDDLVFDDTFQTKDNAFVPGAFLFADGSVRYLQIQEGMDRSQFRALFTMAGKEPSPLTSLYPRGHNLIQPAYSTASEQIRHAEARTQNSKSLKELALAFQNYHHVYRSLPPAVVFGPDGKPWHSWRVVILPFLGYAPLFQEYDGSIPWDHPKNAAVLNKMPAVFRDPLSDKADNKTRYLLATGAGTAFPTKVAANVIAPPPVQPTPSQPAPPKPVAKDGREPIEYQPFRPDVWKAKNQSTWLFPWEGERIVLLTTTADLDPKTMAVFVKQLDAGWKLCSDLVGQAPRLLKQHNGKATIAAVPDASFTGGGLSAYLGMSGIEVGGFYLPRGDYDQVRQNPEKFPDGFFFGIGQNHFVFANQCGVLSTGGIVALRHICAEAINGSDNDPQADQTIYRYEEAFAKSNATFQEAFAPFGATKLFVLNDLNGKPFGNIDLNVFIASTFLKLRKDNGGNEWARRFFRHLATCPPAAGRDIDGANAQTLNWVVAASLAAEKDLSPMLRDRWRFPLAPDLWQTLLTVDWKKPGLTADNVFDALPSEHLLPSVAMARPGFLTPERRKQNLLVGGTFEDGSGGTWTVGSFRGNAAAAAVEGGVAKEGQKAVVIRAPVNDDARYLQRVAVTPNTRYLVSGWIKTKDVVVVEPTGRTGANLSIDAHTYEMSQSVVGTNDWRYASFLFDSGTRTEVLVCARIGFVYSTSKGEAWFDDLCLIPIGPSPVRAGVQLPPPAPGPDEKNNLLVNGSFEEGPEIPADIGWLPNVRVDSTAIKGWTVTRGNIDVVSNKLWIAGHGKRSIDLHGGPGFGGIKQSFKTVVGQRYQVSFLMSGTPQRGIPLFKLAVRAADQQQEMSFDAKGKTVNQMGWTRKTWDFVAITTETTLEIHTLQTTQPDFGPVIDDVSVIALGVKAPGQLPKAEDASTKSAAHWKGLSKDTALAPFHAEQAK